MTIYHFVSLPGRSVRSALAHRAR